MSVTGHRDVRHPDDFYETPAWCVRALLPHLQRGDALDPCCGAGAIGKVLRREWPEHGIYGVEINEERGEQARVAGVFDNVCSGDDFLEHISESKRVPLIITNPPFKLALEFAVKSLRMADTVAFLLRLNWLASEKRRAFHKAHPADLIVLPNRPSFAQFCSCTVCAWKATIAPSVERPGECPECARSSGGQVRIPIKVSSTDSTEYAWFIWGPGRGGRYQLAGEVDWNQVARDLKEGSDAIDAAEGAASAPT